MHPTNGHYMVLWPQKLECTDSRAKADAGLTPLIRHTYQSALLEVRRRGLLASCLPASLQTAVGMCLAPVHLNLEVLGYEHFVGGSWQIKVGLMLL